MRKLERSESPPCLAEAAPGWTQSFVQARADNPAHRFSWPHRPCYAQVRERLVQMTGNHCAFCDGSVGVESRETVEHFRPKSQFPALAYEWVNLFPCCDHCQSAKREQFDERLLKPDEPEYVFEHYFLIDYKTGALEPLPSAGPECRQRAALTLALYDLNSALRRRARLREYQHFCRDPEPCLDDYNYRYFLE